MPGTELKYFTYTTLLILRSTALSWYYFHFANEETEIEGLSKFAQGHTTSKWKSWHLNSGSLTGAQTLDHLNIGGGIKCRS